MKLMHTKLPEYIRKMKESALTRGDRPKTLEIKGLENLTTAKFQSLRTGRCENAVSDMARIPEVDHIVMEIIPRIPETMHSAVIKGYDKDGNPVHCILETTNILHPGEETHYHEFESIDDRRPRIGEH